MAKKKKVDPGPYIKYKLERLHEDFRKKAEDFKIMMQHENGIMCIGMLDTLRDLNTLYLLIAVHTDSARLLGLDETVKV